MTQKTKIILRWIPSVLIALQIGSSAILKFAAVPFFVKNFQSIGLLGSIDIIAAMELIFIVLFIWQRTIKVGLLFLTGYFGGAIAVELVHGTPFVPMIILCIIWFAAWLRQPSIFKLQFSKMALNA